MKNWFPLTDYDFYGYLANGFVLLFVVDYIFSGGVMGRENWTFVQIVLAIAVAYFAGQIFAIPSSIVLEHWLARRVLRPPTALLVGAVQMRRIDWFIARWMVGRYYEPLPEATRRMILEKAAAATNKAIAEIESDPEAIFGVAFTVARRNEDTRQRIDAFRNQYGLNRNMAFTALISACLFFGKAWSDEQSEVHLFAAFASILAAVGLFIRFLKFYSTFAAEVLRTFAFSTHNAHDGG